MLLLLAALVLCSDLMFNSHPLYHGEWMHFGYLKTVENLPAVYAEVPYCWRLLVPALVSILPLPAEWGFLLLTYISLAVTGVLLFSIVRGLAVDVRYAWIALLAYASMVFVLRINVIEFIAVDAPAFMFMTVAVWAILRKKNGIFVLAAVLGVLVKEIVLVVLPLYVTLTMVYGGKREALMVVLRRSVLLALPAVFVFIAMRLLVAPEQNEGYVAMLAGAVNYRLESFAGVLSTLNKDLIPGQSTLLNAAVNIYRITLGAVGPVLLFIVLRQGRIRRELSAWWPLIVLTFLQIFIAYDNERIVASGFLAYVVLYAAAMKSYVDEHAVDLRFLMLLTMLLFLVQLPLRADHYVQTYYTVVAQLMLGAGAALYVHVKWKIPLFSPRRNGVD
jgi:hypothetical protein